MCMNPLWGIDVEAKESSEIDIRKNGNNLMQINAHWKSEEN